MKRILAAAAIVLCVCIPASAHRLDEYLQGTLISVEKDWMRAQIDLTPGVSVFPVLIADIDTNGDGAISETERHAYAGRVLRDLSISIDGHRLTPRLVSLAFPAVEEMKEGRGEIRIELDAALPRGGPDRKLVFEDRHQSRIAAYQVNCLVPQDPDIRIASQHRNYSQSFYELSYVQTGAQSAVPDFAGFTDSAMPLGALALLLSVRLALLWGGRGRAKR
jgi:hypothetical protein